MVLLLAPLGADPSLTHARHAQLLLGNEVWSRILRIENATRDGRYPREFHALVFEYAGLLWFYTSGEGTQSFSLHRGNVDAEKQDFTPMLRDIEPGFRRWREVEARGVRVNRRAPLPNGCWIESVVALRERLAAGERVERPRLLSYYVATPEGAAGHTVLAYERDERLVIFDPAQPLRNFSAPASFGRDALRVARTLEGSRVMRARELPLEAAIDGPSAMPRTIAAEFSAAPMAGAAK